MVFLMAACLKCGVGVSCLPPFYYVYNVLPYNQMFKNNIPSSPSYLFSLSCLPPSTLERTEVILYSLKLHLVLFLRPV